jgi:hypothetical protein
MSKLCSAKTFSKNVSLLLSNIDTLNYNPFVGTNFRMKVMILDGNVLGEILGLVAKDKAPLLSSNTVE